MSTEKHALVIIIVIKFLKWHRGGKTRQSANRIDIYFFETVANAMK